MDAVIVEPPEKKKKTNPTAQPALPVSFSSLPDEIVLSCLARISKSDYRFICLVSKRFYSLLSPSEIYAVRSQIGATEPRIYVWLWIPTNNRWFALGGIEGELSLKPVKFSSSYSHARLKSTTLTVGSEIYLIGGTNNGKRSRAVGVLDCWSHTWRSAPDMRVSRVGAKSWFLDGKIYVTGGCRKKEEKSMNWGEVFDLKTQTWKPLPSPSDDGVDSNHKLAVFGSMLYVITNDNKYAYDPKQERWVGLVGLEHITGPRCGIETDMESVTGPWCVIRNVMFTDHGRQYKWYSPGSGRWRMIYGIDDVYARRYAGYRTIQFVNYGGKLVVVWDQWIWNMKEYIRVRTLNKEICCAVIRLEERSGVLGLKIWGVVEHCNHFGLTVPKSCELSSCQ